MKNSIEEMFARFNEARSVCPALVEDLLCAAVEMSEGRRMGAPPAAVFSPHQTRAE
jgi:hypothetical protein